MAGTFYLVLHRRVEERLADDAVVGPRQVQPRAARLDRDEEHLREARGTLAALALAAAATDPWRVVCGVEFP